MDVHSYFPIFLDLRGRPCVVVGGDTAARAKTEALLAGGARVTVVAPELVPSLAALAEADTVRHVARPYRPGDLAGAFLAISVLADPAINQPFWEEAEERGIPANVMDDAPRCSFIAPSIVRRGHLAIAISTAGRAPALAVRLRERLERCLGPEHARFLELAGALRAPIAERHPDLATRRALWYRIVDSDVLDLLARGDEASAVARIREITGVDLGEVAAGSAAVPV
jgi:siroheme synthase-like protein